MPEPRAFRSFPEIGNFLLPHRPMCLQRRLNQLSVATMNTKGMTKTSASTVRFLPWLAFYLICWLPTYRRERAQEKKRRGEEWRKKRRGVELCPGAPALLRKRYESALFSMGVLGSLFSRLLLSVSKVVISVNTSKHRRRRRFRRLPRASPGKQTTRHAGQTDNSHMT